METTLNMYCTIQKRIIRYACAQGVSPSAVVMRLMKRVMAEIQDPDGIGTMVKYQKRRPREDWHNFHLQLNPDEYECMLDLRKILKMSVSLIVAYAVEKYLDDNFKFNFSDNYFVINYVIIKEIINNIICWKLFWGNPSIIPRLL